MVGDELRRGKGKEKLTLRTHVFRMRSTLDMKDVEEWEGTEDCKDGQAGTGREGRR